MVESTFWLIIIFLFGLSVGSFLNVVIYRLKELETILYTRSHCPHCKTQLKWYDLVPFLSFVLLRTRCRYCGKPISWQYPMVELFTGILFALTWWSFGLSWYSLFVAIIGSFLIVIFTYDLLHYIIPDEVIWPAIILTILYQLAALNYPHIFWPTAYYSNFLNILLGAVICGGFIGIIVALGRAKWMGIGDIKLAVLSGLILAYPRVIVAMFLAFVLGTVIGLTLVISNKKTLKDALPFAPFLVGGTIIALFWGEAIWQWYITGIF